MTVLSKLEVLRGITVEWGLAEVPRRRSGSRSSVVKDVMVVGLDLFCGIKKSWILGGKNGGTQNHLSVQITTPSRHTHTCSCFPP